MNKTKRRMDSRTEIDSEKVTSLPAACHTVAQRDAGCDPLDASSCRRSVLYIVSAGREQALANCSQDEL